MSTENKAVITRWVAARNAADVEAAVAIFAEEWSDRLRKAFNAITNAFPDFHITVKDMIAEGDKVAAQFTLTGTHQGPFQGIAATGKSVSWTGVDIYTVIDGKIAGLERESDMLGLMRQLGAIAPVGEGQK